MSLDNLSDDDLIAISQKNYDALSDEGLLALAETKQNRLADQIPGLQPVGPAPKEPDLTDKVIGGLEGVAHGATSLIGGAVGMTAGAWQDVVNHGLEKAIKGQIPNSKMDQYAQAATYEPKTEYGKELGHGFDEFVGRNIVPLMGMGYHPLSRRESTRIANKEVVKAIKENVAADKFTKFTDENQLLNEHKQSVITDLENLTALENETKLGFETASDQKERQQLLDYYAERRKTLEEELATVEDALGGVPKEGLDQEKMKRDERRQELITKLREENGKAEDLGPITEADRQRMDAELAKEYADDPMFMGEEAVKDAPVKTTPLEVAIARIHQATTFSKKALAKRIQDTIDVIDGIDRQEQEGHPGSGFSALKEALKHELEAYKDIANGKEPNFNKLDNTVKVEQAGKTIEEPPLVGEETRTPTQETLAKRDLVGNLDKDGNLIPERGDTNIAVTYSLKKHISETKYRLGKLQRFLDNVNNKIKSYEEGLTPSGTVDIAQLEKSRRSLEYQISKLSTNLEKALAKLEPKEEKSLPKTDTPIPDTPKFNSIGDILEGSKTEWVDHFLNNPDLFINTDGKVFFDKTIAARLRTIYSNFLEQLGMNKDQVFFINDAVWPDRTQTAGGNMLLQGNTIIIRINPDAVAKRLAHSRVAELTKNLAPKLYNQFETIRIAAHEIGHAFMFKYLKTFGDTEQSLSRIERLWQDEQNGKKDVVSLGDLKNKATIEEKQRMFTEYWADSVSRALLYQNLLSGKFSKYSRVHDGLVMGFSKIIAHSQKMLRAMGIDVYKKDFITDLVNDVITLNKEEIANSGKTIFEAMETKKNDELLIGKGKVEGDLFRDATLEDIRNRLGERGWYDPSGNLDLSINGYQISGLSTRAARMLGRLGGFATRKLFSKNNLAQIYRDYAEVGLANKVICNAEELGTRVWSKLWYGDTVGQPWRDAHAWRKMSKIIKDDSAYSLLKKSSDADLSILHDLFKQGLEADLDYADNLSRNGQHLTPHQKAAYEALSKMFKGMWQATVDSEIALGKINILPYKRGWYPSVRKGIYSVELSFNGRAFRREQFDTKVAAERFTRALNGLNHVDVGPILEHDSTPTQTNAMMADIIKAELARKFPNNATTLNTTIDNLMNRLVTTGGNRSSHHQFRSNMMGYKGTELLKSVDQRGHSFREAIQALATEYPTSITRSHIKTKLEPLMANMADEPKAVVQQMMDSALGRNKDIAAIVTRPADHVMERMVREISEKLFNKEYTFDKSIAKASHDAMVGWFYMLKVIPRLNFVISQFLTIPTVVRDLSYGGHGMKAWWSLGKGMMKLAAATADHPLGRELRNEWEKVSQKYTTFEPKFVEDLKIASNESRVSEFIKDWILLRKPSEKADSASRLMAFSIAFTHYRDLGYSIDRASYEARRSTDATMNVYTTADSAPVFEHLGSLGRTVRPLQSFGQNLLGNFISDAKYFKAKDPNTWAPLVNYGLTTVLFSGVMGSVFIQEYELLRRLLNSQAGTNLPSIIEMFQHDDSMLDRILPDSDAARTALLYGVPSLSGVDLSSSTRANQTFLTLAGSVMLGEEHWNKLMPALGMTSDVVTGFGSLIASKVTDKPNVDIKKAADAAFPAGHIGYGAKEILGANTTKIMDESTDMLSYGKEGDANKERTTADTIAGYLGTKSTEDKGINQRQAALQFNEKVRTDRIKHAAILFAETGKPKYVEELVKLGAEGDQIESIVGTEVYKRIVDQSTRFISDKNGNVSSNNQRKAVGLFRFGEMK